VLVVQGIDGVSSMGGISAAIATPASGNYRLRTAEIMGPVTIGGGVVRPGDLVVPDETGVCFRPYAEAARVLERARAISERESSWLLRLDREIPSNE
jgi:4-hydroxy-4-methyl-2-oxoglutarate aldolase